MGVGGKVSDKMGKAVVAKINRDAGRPH